MKRGRVITEEDCFVNKIQKCSVCLPVARFVTLPREIRFMREYVDARFNTLNCFSHVRSFDSIYAKNSYFVLQYVNSGDAIYKALNLLSNHHSFCYITAVREWAARPRKNSWKYLQGIVNRVRTWVRDRARFDEMFCTIDIGDTYYDLFLWFKNWLVAENAVELFSIQKLSGFDGQLRGCTVMDTFNDLNKLYWRQTVDMQSRPVEQPLVPSCVDDMSKTAIELLEEATDCVASDNDEHAFNEPHAVVVQPSGIVANDGTVTVRCSVDLEDEDDKLPNQAYFDELLDIVSQL